MAITETFKNNVHTPDNLSMVRIMLKNSFLTDHTCKEFDEMFRYAKKNLPGLVVPYDNKPLETDCNKWNKDTLKTELVGLIDNFSEERIEHLKKVVKKIYPQTSVNKPQKTSLRQKAKNFIEKIGL